MRLIANPGRRILIITCGIIALLLILRLYPRTIASDSKYKSAILNIDNLVGIDPVDIEKQRAIFRKQASSRQKLNNNPEKIQNLHYTAVPEVDCSTMVRLGDAVDGGKWICNPWRVGNDSVVYSLGVGGNPSFEYEMAEVTDYKCRIFSFDPNTNYAQLFINRANLFYRPWKLVQTTDWSKNETTLADAMAKLGHDRVEILKMDIENYEYDVLPSMLQRDKPLFCQLLLEMHQSNAKRWADLLKAIASANYYMFSKEVNTWCLKGDGYCIEYSFIHEQCFAQYHVLLKPYHRNFED